jgi:3-oxoacyl-[acyl-carrier protein] reductase
MTTVTDLMDLKGKVGLVTGAGQGVGRQIALHFAQHGAGGVVVNDFYLDRAEEVAAEIVAAGCKALPVQADVSSLDEVTAMVDRAVAELGRLDIVVNNAGSMGPEPDAVTYKVFWETTPQEWARWTKTNFDGVLNCSYAALRHMVPRGEGGRLITIVSDAARVGEARLAVYSGAKAGAAGFMRGIAKEVARHDITANTVSIGSTKTPSTEAKDPELLKKVLRNYPLGRRGEPEDIANMVLFLASDAGSWITGQTYPVNGGYAFNV